MHLFVSVLLFLASPGQQASSAPSADTRFYAVSYVEATASSAAKAVALLKQYRDASAKQDGYVSIELFEQIGRPGHFALLELTVLAVAFAFFEVWRDLHPLYGRDASLLTQRRVALQPILVSDYDQRPYKTISVDDRRGGRPAASQVIVLAHVDVAPNPQVAVMLKDLAEASRKEPGNVRFDVVQHTMRANHFTVLEVWRDQQALDSHVSSPHTRQYRDTLQPMTGSPLDERVYKAVD